MPDFPAGTPVRATQLVVSFNDDGSFNSAWVYYNLIGSASGQPVKTGSVQLTNLTSAQKNALANHATNAAAQAKNNEGV